MYSLERSSLGSNAGLDADVDVNVEESLDFAVWVSLACFFDRILDVLEPIPAKKGLEDFLG